MHWFSSLSWSLALASVLCDGGIVTTDPVNFRYFNRDGRTLAFVGSGEHYGAVLNLDMDYETYLRSLAASGLQLTRTWTGAWYREQQGAFGIRRNTLAPAPGRYLAPWSVSSQCCFNNTPGVPKYDMTGFNQSYFDRLSDFLTLADSLGVYVNLGLCSVYYDDSMWILSPFYPGNNVNGVGGNVSVRNDVYRCSNPTDVYSCMHPDIVNYQIAFVNQVIKSVGSIGNWWFEIINEPYASGGADSPYYNWQSLISAAMQASMSATGTVHIIEQNYHDLNARWYPSQRVPGVSYVSWHYMQQVNMELNKGISVTIGTSETGFEGPEDAPYRTTGWLTMLSGAATYNNLDYSWSTLLPNGTDMPIPDGTPGGGGPSLRTSLGALQGLLNELPLAYVTPSNDMMAILGDWPPDWYRGAQYGILANVSASQGVIAGYMTSATGWYNNAVSGTAFFGLLLPELSGVSTNWTATWIDPISGNRTAPFSVSPNGDNVIELTTPQFTMDIAFVMRRS